MMMLSKCKIFVKNQQRIAQSQFLCILEGTQGGVWGK